MINSYQKLSLKNMINFANPRSFAASLIPSVFGLVLCAKFGLKINVLKSIFIVISCILFQSAVNTLNDHSDFIKGVDSINDNLEEKDNIMAYNNLDPKKVEMLGYVYLILGIIFGFLSLKNFNKYTLTIAFIGFLTVFFYSKGSLPISYLPIGEIVSGLVMGGLIPLGVYSSIANNVNNYILIYSLPFIIGISMIMMSNNGSDIEKDFKSNRYTLAVVMGRDKFAKLYHISTVFWLLSVISLIYYFAGIGFLIISLIIFTCKYKIIISLLKTKLEPSMRIKNMQTIVKANYFINSVYVLILALSLIKG